MNDPITWSQIGAVLATAGALGALWFRIEQAIGKVRDDLAAFKLFVSEHYSRDGDVREVEIRVLGQVGTLGQNIGSQMKDMATEIRDMRTAFDELRKELIKRRGGS